MGAEAEVGAECGGPGGSTEAREGKVTPWEALIPRWNTEEPTEGPAPVDAAEGAPAAADTVRLEQTHDIIKI